MVFNIAIPDTENVYTISPLRRFTRISSASLDTAIPRTRPQIIDIIAIITVSQIRSLPMFHLFIPSIL